MATVGDRNTVLGVFLAVILSAVLIIWNMGAEASCEDRGGRIEWEVNGAQSTAYGRCVLPGT